MAHTIKTVYVIHHSHTDIGYTDLQERVIETQVDYIRSVLKLMEREENRDFRWNCETLFCVEKFFETAAEEEKEAFCRLAGEGRLGLSANYLNFTDLVDSEVLRERLAAWQRYLGPRGAAMNTAMIADINGISMGCRNALLENGVEFLYANIHCHHGMYPLYQNQTAFFWDAGSLGKLLVWNGEHYNLGNVLGLKPNRNASFMHRTYMGQTQIPDDAVEVLRQNLDDYLDSCESQCYPYDFIISSVSGVFSDNAPPEPQILRTIESYNRLDTGVRIQMVSLQELYVAVKDKLADAPVYRGDLTDWWANGVGSTPYAVKHYREARQRFRLCRRLDPELREHYPDLVRMAEDNLLLYAEHTWGHSSTITNPYDTMVLNLDARKNSYASKAHEAASLMLTKIAAAKGDLLRYYNTSGRIRVCNPSNRSGRQAVEFYIENGQIGAMEILDQAGREIPCQVSPHPRGRKITFVADLAARGDYGFRFRELPAPVRRMNTRRCYVGSEEVRDIVNDYDPESYKLPYGFENRFFQLSYRPHRGVTSFVDKLTGRELLGKGIAPFFTPIHQITPVTEEHGKNPWPGEYERRLLGRNIRGKHAVTTVGHLEEVIVEERGPVFTQLRLRFTLPGTIHSDVIVKFFEEIPRIDFWLEIGKTLSTDIESVFLPLSLDLEGEVWLKKGAEAFRPGVDQIPGTCMEFYMTDCGVSYTAPAGAFHIAVPDTPMIYMGEMDHHPIRLCDGAAEHNTRPVYSWVMNNNWETNFKMDLAGFCQFRYSLWRDESAADGETAAAALEEHCMEPYAFIVE